MPDAGIAHWPTPLDDEWREVHARGGKVARVSPLASVRHWVSLGEGVVIHPFALVVNQSFSPNGFPSPALIQRGQRELPYITEVQQRHATRVSLIPWMANAPTGHSGLRALVGSTS